MTTEQILNPEYQLLTFGHYLSEKEKLIEFANYHVVEALKKAEDSNFIDAKGISISPKSNNLHWTAYGHIGNIVYNKEAIINAYPKSNIK